MVGVLVLVRLVRVVSGMVTVVEEHSSSDDVLVLVGVSQSVAVTMAHDVSQPMSRHFSLHGCDVYDVAGVSGQSQCWVSVLRTRHSSRGHVWQRSLVDVMVGQAVPDGSGGEVIVEAKSWRGTCPWTIAGPILLRQSERES